LQSKSFPVERLSAAAAGFLIGGESLAYRLDSTWKLIGGGAANGGGSGVYREWLEWPFYVEFSLLRTDFKNNIYLFTVESVYIHVTSGDVGSQVADYFGIRGKNCGSFVDATSSET